jgi:hypothetical protein
MNGMRICIETATNKLIEMQSGATEGTLTQNAITAGYELADIEEREVTPEEYQALKASQPKTQDELNAPILAELSALDSYIPRGLEDTWDLLSFDENQLPEQLQAKLTRKVELRSMIVK